ncbi:MAG: hypothetical protein ISN29_12025 [Gammaproteobacteria bacterium AqS3]|nr:hypothetical protein [Gammaproteobacteria bacterium AqS3]
MAKNDSVQVGQVGDEPIIAIVQQQGDFFTISFANIHNGESYTGSNSDYYTEVEAVRTVDALTARGLTPEAVFEHLKDGNKMPLTREQEIWRAFAEQQRKEQKAKKRSRRRKHYEEMDLEPQERECEHWREFGLPPLPFEMKLHVLYCWSWPNGSFYWGITSNPDARWRGEYNELVEAHRIRYPQITKPLVMARDLTHADAVRREAEKIKWHINSSRCLNLAGASADAQSIKFRKHAELLRQSQLSPSPTPDYSGPIELPDEGSFDFEEREVRTGKTGGRGRSKRGSTWRGWVAAAGVASLFIFWPLGVTLLGVAIFAGGSDRDEG